MGSTPTAAASKDENPAESPEASSSTKTGARSRARKKQSTGKKKAVTKKAARKAAAARKTATGKKAAKKSAGSKAPGSKKATPKASVKKAVRKKAAGKKSASKKTAPEKKPSARSRKRPGLAGVTATTPPEAVAEKAAARSDDPRSLSWMAASAVDALNAVKAHQAEKATHIRETHGAATALPETELDDVYADDPDAISPQAVVTQAGDGALTGGAGVEPAQDTISAGETPATAMPALEEPEAPAEGAEPAGDTLPGAAADAVAGELGSPADRETSPPGTGPAGAVTDVEETRAAESAGDAAGPDSLATATEAVDTPTDGEPGTVIPPASADEHAAPVDEPTEKPAAGPEVEDTVGETPPEAAGGEGKEEPPLSADEPAEPSAQVSKPTPPPPPPPVQRQGMPVRLITVAVVLGLAVLFGYRLMVDEDEMTAPVAGLPADDSPGVDMDRPPISVLPVTVETAPQETLDVPAAIPPDETASAVAGNEAPPAAGTGGQADAGDAPMQAETPAQVEEPAGVTDVPDETAAASVEAPPGVPSPEPVVMEEPPASTDTLDATSAEAADAQQPRPVAQTTDAAPAPSPAPPVEPAPSEPARATAPVTRQPAYRTPGYGYYPRGWQQPSYGYPGWQSPPAGR